MRIRYKETRTKEEKMSEQKIIIPPLKREIVELMLIGDNSLICNRFSEKAQKEIEDKQQGKPGGARKKRDPQKEFQNSLHVLNGEKDFKKQEFGFPVGGLKKAMLNVAADIEGVAGTHIRMHIHIIANEGNLLKIYGCRPKFRQDWGTIARGTRSLMYRGMFDRFCFGGTG